MRFPRCCRSRSGSLGYIHDTLGHIFYQLRPVPSDGVVIVVIVVVGTGGVSGATAGTTDRDRG